MNFPCTGNEQVFPNIELVSIATGKVINTIVASECFASWYAPKVGCTWRHWSAPEPGQFNG